jgi:hypothetical protein
LQTVHVIKKCASSAQTVFQSCRRVLQTEVTQEQSMALVEYIAHLSLRDWAAVPEDLRRLGFISADAPDSSVIAEPLGRILGQISIGDYPGPAAPVSTRHSPPECSLSDRRHDRRWGGDADARFSGFYCVQAGGPRG